MVIIYMSIVIGILALAQFGIYRKFWFRRLSVKVNFSSREAFEGDELHLNEELANKKLLPLPWVMLSLKIPKSLTVGGERQESEAGPRGELFSIARYQSVKRKVRLKCSRRGYYVLRGADVVCADLLHTRRFKEYVRMFVDLTVFPRYIDDYLELDIMQKNLDSLVLSNSLINPDPFEFRGLREYHPTDPLKNVNFKATAIVQQLMVNIHAPTASRRLEIVLNLEQYLAAELMNTELYEQAIRLAATMARRYIDQDVKVGFFTNGTDISTKEPIRIHGGNSTAHLYSILQALARVDIAQVGVYHKAEKISPYLEGIVDTEAVYLIISPYYGPDFADAVALMREKGTFVYVIVPVARGSDVVLHDAAARIWEAI